MKKLLLLILFFLFTSNYLFSKSDFKNDSIDLKVYEDIVNYIRMDTSLNSVLTDFNIKEFCISNSVVWTSCLFFFDDIVNYKFPNLDSVSKRKISNLLYAFQQECYPIENKNYFKNYGTNDSCRAILFLSQLKGNMIRADVDIYMKYSKVLNYNEANLDAALTYSYLFIIEDNKIEKVFMDVVAYSYR